MKGYFAKNMNSRTSVLFSRDSFRPDRFPADNAKQNCIKAEMKSWVNLVRAHGHCEWDLEAWWLQELAGTLETSDKTGGGDVLGIQLSVTMHL